MSIKLKIILLTLLSGLLLVAAFMGNIFYQEKKVSSKVSQELDGIMLQTTKTVALNVDAQLQALNDVLVSEIDNDLKVAWDVMNQQGHVRIEYDQPVKWDIVNQFTQSSNIMDIPKMTVGGTWLGQNSSLDKATPIVDEVKNLVGGTTTIFQKINEDGDMLRVATNVENLDGTRAIGTYIPAYNTDGTENPVVKTLMEGKVFNGRAYVVNAWYLTTYSPIFDENKNVIGALYFGIQQEKTAALRKGILNTVLGKNGHIYVLDRDAKYLISPDGKNDGESLTNTRDVAGNYYARSIVKKALDLSSGQVEYEKYQSVDAKDTPDQNRLVAITYYKPWDWIICAEAYENDFKESHVKMQEAVQNMALWGAITCAAAMLIIFFASVLVASKITNPIVELTKAVDDISKGNLDRKIHVTSSDETGALATSFKRMQSSLVILMQRNLKKR